MKNNFKTLDYTNLILQPHKLDLWQYSLKEETSSTNLFLNDEELQRANRYYFKHHQRRFTNARNMLRIILGRYLNQNPATICFNENKYGKPELKNNTTLKFNLSHSEDLALVAITMHTEVGVDVEYFSDRPYDGIAKNMFSDAEIINFNQITPEHKQAAFYNVWSQKEALIKACGLGLSYPTQQFSVPVLSNIAVNSVYDSIHNKTWYMQTFMPNAQCYAAICYDTQINEIYYGIL